MSSSEDNVELTRLVCSNWHKHRKSFEVQLLDEKALVTSLGTSIADVFYDGRVELYSDRKVAVKYLDEEEFKLGGSGVAFLFKDVELVIYVVNCRYNTGHSYLEFVLASPDSHRGSFRFSGMYHESVLFDAAANFDKLLISDVTKRRRKIG